MNSQEIGPTAVAMDTTASRSIFVFGEPASPPQHQAPSFSHNTMPTPPRSAMSSMALPVLSSFANPKGAAAAASSKRKRHAEAEVERSAPEASQQDQQPQHGFFTRLLDSVTTGASGRKRTTASTISKYRDDLAMLDEIPVTFDRMDCAFL
mmetsp:Transcript_24398/g.67984  ORF Transcript_24398/g.67984 Transcript_24398/m.67984 type:complete len:151 (-) Transcript_24398:83-535(-)